MHKRVTLLFATALAFAGSAMAAPVAPFAPDSVSRGIDAVVQPDDHGLILVQNRGRGGGGGQRSAGGGGQRAAGGEALAPRQFQQQQLPSGRGEHWQQERQYEPDSKRQHQPDCECQREPQRECQRRRGWLLLRQLQQRTELGRRRGRRRGRCCCWRGREFRGPVPHLCSSSSDLSAWLRPAPTRVASTGEEDQGSTGGNRTPSTSSSGRISRIPRPS